ALLAFTSLATLHAWRPDARPVPVSARDAARAALQDGADAIVIDLAGPTAYPVEGDDLLALASGWRLARVGEGSAWIRPAPIRPAEP
ncbi:MAG: SseB family protein, partial [Nocardioides sp.]|uniref:SseB family protein n=1 Tax=Nocardioides sp. TaxID=35761 RepID=UPI0039E7094B